MLDALRPAGRYQFVVPPSGDEDEDDVEDEDEDEGVVKGTSGIEREVIDWINEG